MFLQQKAPKLLAHFETHLAAELAELGPASRLNDAMRYTALAGGKRIRPLLVYATGEALGASIDTLTKPAIAIELIHCYSLIHDDLPAMDDDDLRRGKPTCHVAFDEATAILAGDALQAKAFEVLAKTTIAEHASHPAQFHAALIGLLAKHSGSQGMVGGQSLDLQAEGKHISLAALEQMHCCKTGALIECAVELGAIVGGASDSDRQTLNRFAKAMGLAFQVQDDVLDIESDTATLGKPQGSDIAANKNTYPEKLGLDGAKAKADSLYQNALAELKTLSFAADDLVALANHIVERKN